MVCTSPSLTVESYEDVSTAVASGTGTEGQKPVYRRRHSSFHPRRKSTESGLDGDDRLLLKVGSKQVPALCRMAADLAPRSICSSLSSRDG